MDSYVVEGAVRSLIRNVLIVGVILFIVAFFIGRCSAGCVAKAEPAKEQANG